MSTLAALPAVQRRLSISATKIYAISTAVSLSAASSAPTPLYHLYQQKLGLSAFTVTLIFACYAFTMVATFLTAARLSDYVGRRPMILAALLLNSISLVLFIIGGAVPVLVAARLVQGVAISVGMATLGAAILDIDRIRGPIYNSITAFLGLTLGSLLGGALVTWAPLPMQLVFIVLLGVMLAEMALLVLVPETISRKPGALRMLVPDVTVPAVAVPAILWITPLNMAVWALGGFYLSLMPTLVAVATGTRSTFVGAVVVATLMATAAATVLACRHTAPARLLNLAALCLAAGVTVTLAGIMLQSVAVMLAGTLIAGMGFGSGYSGSFRILLPLAEEHERAGLLAAYFVESYLSFAVPAVLAGLAVPTLGLVMTSKLYGAAAIALALVSLLIGTMRRTALCEA